MIQDIFILLFLLYNIELKKRKYYAKPSLKKRLKREEAARQRVKDKHKAIRNALKSDEGW